MPRLQYVTIKERDLGAGIDQQSPENKIMEGFCEDIINADPKSTGQIAKRVGYQGYAGCLPVRVQSVKYDNDEIEFTFDSSIELPTRQSSPIIVYGKSNITDVNADFYNEEAVYYSGYTADIRNIFLTGTNTFTFLGVDHGIETPYMVVGVSESTSIINNSNEYFFTNEVTIDKTTYDIDIDYTNNTGSDISTFVYAKEKTTSAGTVYIHNQAVGVGTNNYNVLGSTHQLDNTNIIVEVYEDTGTELIKRIPDEVTLDNNTGDVQVQFRNVLAGFNAVFILTAVPANQFITGAVSPGATTTTVIDISDSDATDFLFTACYVEQTIGVGDFIQVVPDSIIVDSVNQEATITFVNNGVVGATYEIYWEYATIATNKLTVISDYDIGGTFENFAPELTIWGLCHEDIYGTRVAREGWTNHIDSYKVPGDERLISGLGGNLFAARTINEVPEYLLPLLYPRINGRLAADIITAPAFWDTGEDPGRTRGYITADNGANNFYEITDINYNSGTGYTDYTLFAPNISINGTLSTIISTVDGLEDELTAEQCGYSFFNGTFKIKNVTNPDANTLVISVINNNIDSNDFDESDVGGDAGIFTDQVTLIASSEFLPGDSLQSTLFSEADNYNVIDSSDTTLAINNVLDIQAFPGGLRLVGTRTGSIIPLRNEINLNTIENMLRGDMLSYSEFNRQLHIKSVNALGNIDLTLTGDGETVTVTMGSGNTESIFAGKKLLILQSDNYSGEILVDSVISETEFTFLDSAISSESGILLGNTIEVDESLEFNDTSDNSVYLWVNSRWIPIETPKDNYDLTPDTIVSHFDSLEYDNQNILRSTMVADNLYLTNFSDEVLKFDGVNLYRAGLFRWQPHFFVNVDTNNPTIVTGEVPVDVFDIDATGYQFVIDEGDENRFSAGDIIYHDDGTSSSGYYTIDNVHSKDAGGANKGHIAVKESITGLNSGTITIVSFFKYYFRLNAIDANNNIIASATTGSDDFVVRTSVNCSIDMKLVGMPAWDIYDYDRLEVQIFRTYANEAAVYHPVTTLQMSFDNNDGYINYTDTFSDEDLISDDPLRVLSGQFLGNTWNQPIRAKYCTTAGNKLVLGNLKDYPELDIKIVKNIGTLDQSVFLNADNQRWLFRKDNTDTATTTDMINRAAYEFTNLTLDITTPATDVVNNANGTFSITTSVNHNLSVGDWVYLYHDAYDPDNNLEHAGWYQVSAENGTTLFTVNDLNESNFTTPTINKVAIASDTKDIPVLIGDDYNYSMRNGNRDSTLSYKFVAMRRLANAINASMRLTDISISGFEEFTPWMIASAGNEFESGQLIIRQPKVFNTFLEVQLPTLTEDFDVYANNVKRAGGSSAGTLERRYPSRIIASYANYPEIFDATNAVQDSNSDSAIDINSADGQEITGIIPFFGDSAFGAAQKSGVIVVFKTNSIYLVDLNQKDLGNPSVQKLETRGKGCTAPYSIAVTKDGIMFANDTGIYKLTRDLKVNYIGRKYERKWNNTVNKNQLSIATGHHDTNFNQYKLSYPIDSNIENSEVAVYNHTREYEGTGNGSWTTYDNHPATGWANLNTNSYFSTTNGKVYVIRNQGDNTDYRDDDQPIIMTILARALDMGDSGVRKVFSQITTHYRTVGQSTGTSLEAALDLKDVFQNTDTFIVTRSEEDTGIDDFGLQKVVTIQSVIDAKVGVYLQLKYTNSNIDEPIEIVGIDIRVANKGDKGLTQAAKT